MRQAIYSRTLLALFFSILCTAPGLQAQTPSNRDAFTIAAVRVETAPEIDGRLDDPAWQEAPLVEEFVQQEPKVGAPATERTEVRVVYTSRYLFVGVHAFDSSPEEIIATEMRRDSDRLFEEDNFQIILDTFNDLRSGYMFVTNPLGAKLEQQIAEEGEGSGRGSTSNINRNWDGVWEVAARRTDDGWIAEIAFPTSTIRFREAESMSWGLNFMRSIRRKNEQVFWAPIPKAYTLTRVSLAGTLEGLRGLSQGMDLRVKPFFISGARSIRAGNSPDMKTSFLRDGGLDAKYGINSALNLDITLNTDFAQAEADEQQVNLTRFSLFFPEKRDFFLENSGLFNVGSGRQLAELFFSRRIGLSATGQPIPIVGGARLTGKAGRNNLALLNIQTGEESGQPGENFLVARYSRDILSRSKIGGLVVDKEAMDGPGFNRTLAVDASFALLGNLSLNSFLAKTSTPGTRDGDMAFFSRAGWRDRNWNLSAQYMDVQDRFNAEVGFVPRRGIRSTEVYLSRTPRPKKFYIRLIEPMIIATYTTDQNNRLLTRKMHHMVAFTLENGTYINFIYNRYLEQLDEPFRLQRNVVIPRGPYRFGEWVFQFNSDPSRRVYETFRYSPQTFYGGFRKDLEATVGVRASSQIAAEVEYRRNFVTLPWGQFTVNLGILRFDYALSPRMTLRSLVQHNSSTRETSTTIRYNYIYRPGSDLYIVYNDLRTDLAGAPLARDRQFVVKMNFMLSR